LVEVTGLLAFLDDSHARMAFALPGSRLVRGEVFALPGLSSSGLLSTGIESALLDYLRLEYLLLSSFSRVTVT
jgi:hypothetical protein